jgi:hypothetical protein
MQGGVTLVILVTLDTLIHDAPELQGINKYSGKIGCVIARVIEGLRLSADDPVSWPLVVDRPTKVFEVQLRLMRPLDKPRHILCGSCL